MRNFCLLGFALVASSALSSPKAADDPPPVPSGLSESVEVRLVTFEVVALDGKSRTVADLTKGDFQLRVDGIKTPIDTLDIACEGGSLDDPKSKQFGGWPTPPDLATGTRRVVLAFDYPHLRTTCPDASASHLQGFAPQPCLYHTQSLQDYQAMLAAKADVRDEEMMVVSLTGGLSVEQPFTRDRDAVVATLRRMEHDVTLWNGNFDHLTELSLFAGLDALVTVLHALPGPKAVVFVTAGLGPDESYELEFEHLAAAARDAQVAIYPVDCRGVFGSIWAGGLPAGLARLASVTGGRLVHNTNDPTVGYARARRDLGCHYTIGFYDRKPEEDRRHALRVECRRAGVNLLYADRYTFPSIAERRKAAVEAAYMVPEMFETGGMRAKVFTLQPKDTAHWDALVAVDFPIPMSGLKNATSRREFGVVLQRGSEIAHSFERSITLQSTGSGVGPIERRITFLEPAEVRPGPYVVTAVLSDPRSDETFTAAAALTVPEIPKGEAFLTDPILGRLSGDDVVVYGKEGDTGAPADRVGTRASIRPLLVDEATREQPLAALTSACVVKPRRGAGPWVATRALLTETGSAAYTAPDVELRSDGSDVVQCRHLFDELPVPNLDLGRYTFRATLARAVPGLGAQETREAPIALVATPVGEP